MSSERERELRRRRKRRRALDAIKKRAEKSNPSEKEVLAAKIRRMTPGAETVIAELNLEG